MKTKINVSIYAFAYFIDWFWLFVKCILPQLTFVRAKLFCYTDRKCVYIEVNYLDLIEFEKYFPNSHTPNTHGPRCY